MGGGDFYESQDSKDCTVKKVIFLYNPWYLSIFFQSTQMVCVCCIKWIKTKWLHRLTQKMRRPEGSLLKSLMSILERWGNMMSKGICNWILHWESYGSTYFSNELKFSNTMECLQFLGLWWKSLTKTLTISSHDMAYFISTIYRNL